MRIEYANVCMLCKEVYVQVCVLSVLRTNMLCAQFGQRSQRSKEYVLCVRLCVCVLRKGYVCEYQHQLRARNLEQNRRYNVKYYTAMCCVCDCVVSACCASVSCVVCVAYQHQRLRVARAILNNKSQSTMHRQRPEFAHFRK